VSGLTQLCEQAIDHRSGLGEIAAAEQIEVIEYVIQVVEVCANCSAFI
jgi:hypothetical protein